MSKAKTVTTVLNNIEHNQMENKKTWNLLWWRLTYSSFCEFAKTWWALRTKIHCRWNPISWYFPMWSHLSISEAFLTEAFNPWSYELLKRKAKRAIRFYICCLFFPFWGTKDHKVKPNNLSKKWDYSFAWSTPWKASKDVKSREKSLMESFLALF